MLMLAMIKNGIDYSFYKTYRDAYVHAYVRVIGDREIEIGTKPNGVFVITTREYWAGEVISTESEGTQDIGRAMVILADHVERAIKARE